ncbi:hypothetical protein J6590_049443 [Homalodisca vitripennis]|nr:hypothetical protein J6590_049443 [Homalodisca vitripennis]
MGKVNSTAEALTCLTNTPRMTNGSIYRYDVMTRTAGMARRNLTATSHFRSTGGMEGPRQEWNFRPTSGGSVSARARHRQRTQVSRPRTDVKLELPPVLNPTLSELTNPPLTGAATMVVTLFQLLEPNITPVYENNSLNSSLNLS